MGMKKIVKKGLFSGFSVKHWVGADHLQKNGRLIGVLLKNLFSKSGNKADDDVANLHDFEACMRHYGLSKQDLKDRMKRAKYVALFCSLVSVVPLGFVVFYWMHGRILPGLVSLMVASLLFANAFREHFNFFQMKQRRLGCHFKEYFKQLVTKGFTL